jgi:two-component system phosphate regulon sensor histidine kinase PhoR
MSRVRSTHIIFSYVVSLVVAIALLVLWVIYVVRSGARIEEVASRLGRGEGSLHWVVLVVGCVLLTVLIFGLTYQLAQTFAARRYSRKQEEFVANITHELKSPLAAIQLHAQTLQQGDLAEADRERSVGFILQSAERMSRLVDNVLESSRLIARRQLLELEPIALAGFFGPYLAEASQRVAGHGVELKSELATHAVVMATGDALRRVMDNLIDNATHFSMRGGEVRCRVRDQAGGVRIEVEDDGIGIPKQELKKVFDRFYQIGKEISGRRQGTGLGLSIVSALVRQMRGTVRAFSQEGKPGTCFVIELPAVEAAS